VTCGFSDVFLPLVVRVQCARPPPAALVTRREEDRRQHEGAPRRSPSSARARGLPTSARRRSRGRTRARVEIPTRRDANRRADRPRNHPAAYLTLADLLPLGATRERAFTCRLRRRGFRRPAGRRLDATSSTSSTRICDAGADQWKWKSRKINGAPSRPDVTRARTLCASRTQQRERRA